MIMIDGHLDIALNGFVWNRDLRHTAHQIREDEAGMTQKGRAAGTIGFPDLRAAEMAISLVTVLARVNSQAPSGIDYRTHEAAYAHAQGELAYYREMERQGVVRMLRDWPAVEAHMADWRANPETAPFGFILCMEGADPVVEPDQLDLWWHDGLRVLSLAHYGPSAYAYGTASVGGVKPAGFTLLDRMAELGMILDVTHLVDDSFWEAVNHFPGRVLASHSNARALVPGDRQLTDDMLRHLFERDAVIGCALDAWMLSPGWVRGETTPQGANVSLDTYVDHIDYICQLAGTARHVAIGTDLDGGYGIEQTPHDLDTIADLQKVPDLLRARGYAEADIAGICHGNWLRFFQSAWGGS